MKDKLFFLRCHINGIPNKHRASNGGCSKDLLIRCKSRKRVAEILNTTTAYLREYGLIQEVHQHLRGGDCIGVVPEDEIEQIYYAPEHTAKGFVKGWFKL
jgi:hypothetical protein